MGYEDDYNKTHTWTIMSKLEQDVKVIIDKIAQAVISSLGSWVNDIDAGRSKYVVTTLSAGIIHSLDQLTNPHLGLGSMV